MFCTCCILAIFFFSLSSSFFLFFSPNFLPLHLLISSYLSLSHDHPNCSFPIQEPRVTKAQPCSLGKDVPLHKTVQYRFQLFCERRIFPPSSGNLPRTVITRYLPPSRSIPSSPSPSQARSPPPIIALGANIRASPTLRPSTRSNSVVDLSALSPDDPDLV